MREKIVVIGAGIIGAALSYRLAQRGADVTILEAANPAAEASGRSFGWINASFYADKAHFRLRFASMQAWRDLCDEVTLPVNWQGALWWEEQGAALDAMAARLYALGYPVEKLSSQDVAKALPEFSVLPNEALFFPSEGAAECGMLTQVLIGMACARGARLLSGTSLREIVTLNGQVRRLALSEGQLDVDRVIVAAGVGAPDLLAPLGINLPMLRRPGLLMTTSRVSQKLKHILVVPEGEIRQLPDGRLLMPTVAGHQSDTTDVISHAPSELAAPALAHLRAMFPQNDLRMESVTHALRPVPLDGLPVIGESAVSGLSVAVMHSGATLAAGVAAGLTSEILDGKDQPLFAPYRLARFQN